MWHILVIFKEGSSCRQKGKRKEKEKEIEKKRQNSDGIDILFVLTHNTEIKLVHLLNTNTSTIIFHPDFCVDPKTSRLSLGLLSD